MNPDAAGEDAVPVAFYAPLKSPHSEIPSGERTMARLLMEALALAGFAPRLWSELRSHEPTGDASRQRAVATAAGAEAERLCAAFARLPAPARPRLWFTYHCYYKAPDHLGPIVAQQFGLPYVVAEGSRSPRRAAGPWAEGHRAAESALDAARLLFVMTERDRTDLAAARPPGQVLVSLPPFLRAADWARPCPHRSADVPVRLLAAAMMRAGDKLASYRVLAEALGRIATLDWTLAVAGDGPARAEVERLFAPFGPRVSFRGELAPPDLAAAYADTDLFVWPAVNEAYGMVLLEAQAVGCPVVAGDFGGVASAMVAGRTGLLTTPGDAGAFAAAVAELIRDPVRRAAMAHAAAAFARDERDIAAAAAILRSALWPLVEPRAAAA